MKILRKLTNFAKDVNILCRVIKLLIVLITFSQKYDYALKY